eukprot:TRINITY_DN707_c1_g1_i2.p1 TRINITY_DN707_c1_g1~~TRINITY_DN707_c1_g1_i2.p1  ORF type:complete len:193 (+),score=10.11 TRINITY_DN707_c1_g1_i2:72-650(+)
MERVGGDYVEQGDACQSIPARFGISSDTFKFLNQGLVECTLHNVVCVEYGYRSALGYPCASYTQIAQGDTCNSIIAAANTNDIQFYTLNPGVNCNKLQTGDQVCTYAYMPTLVDGGSSSKSLLGIGVAKCSDCSSKKCFKVQKGDTCPALLATYWHCANSVFKKFNQNQRCTTAKLFPGQILCKPKIPGGCY